MNFTKYQHVERLGTTETDGILDGDVLVFPKIDGTNCSVWLGDDGDVHCSNRNKEIIDNSDGVGFYDYVQKNKDNFLMYFKWFPSDIIYGEWLKDNSKSIYRKDAVNEFYVFDVFDTDKNEYIDYDFYSIEMAKIGIKFIPVILYYSAYTDKEDIRNLTEENTFLVDLEKYPDFKGEGIVIKNYCYKNKYGRTTWAKVVRSEYKTAKKKAKNKNTEDLYKNLEYIVVESFVTQAFLEKEKMKLEEERGCWASPMLGEFLGRSYNTFIKEEMWNIIKKYKNPTIDFKLLNKAYIDKVKETMSEIF